MSTHKKGYRGSRRRASAARQQSSLWIWVTLGGLLLAVTLFLIFQVTKDGLASQATGFTPAVIGRPQVAVSQDKVDYGDVKLGQTITTVFDVRNTGDQNLVILGAPQVEVVEGC
jgi:hypothetical protein